MSNVFDFDAFVEEQEQSKKPIIIKIYGKEEKLPSMLPASVILKILRLQRKNKDETISPETIFEMATAIFGEERFNSWLNKGMSIEQMETLISRTMGMYSGTLNKEDPEEEKDGNSKKTP